MNRLQQNTGRWAVANLLKRPSAAHLVASLWLAGSLLVGCSATIPENGQQSEIVKPPTNEQAQSYKSTSPAPASQTVVSQVDAPSSVVPSSQSSVASSPSGATSSKGATAGEGSAAASPNSAMTISPGAPASDAPLEKQGSKSGDDQKYAGTTRLIQPAAEPPSTDPAAAWPLFRGNPQATGTAAIPWPDLTKDLDLLWEHRVRPQGEFSATPCLTLIRGEPVAVIGDMNGWVVALNLTDGNVRWTYKLKFGFACSVANHADKFYVGSIDGDFICLDENGQLKWHYTGAMQIDSSASFHEQWVLFTSQDSQLYALNQETGELAWSLSAADQLRCAPVVVEGQVFLAGCDAALHSIRLADRENLFDVPIDSPTGCTPAQVGDLLFFGTEQAGFYAIDWRKQSIAWRFDDQGELGKVHANAAATAERVVLASINRQVISLAPQTGEIQWKRSLRSSIEASPVIVGESVIVASKDGRLYVLNQATGAIEWEREFPGQFVGSPAVGFSRVVIANDEGVIYCLGRGRAN